MPYQKTILDNGVTVISDSMPDVRSVALGLWFNVGSRDERTDQAGLTHFMEHMMFKGTPTRNAFEISQHFDALGAELNAFTSREYTCYYTRLVDEKLPQAFPVLADMVVNSQFSDETITPERKVVLEEIARTSDTPDDYIYDLYASALMPTHPLGRPVLGTKELVSGYHHENCIEFHNQHYYSGNLVVAAAGNVDHEQLVELSRTYLSEMPQGTKAQRSSFSEEHRSDFAAEKHDTEQAHVLYGVPWMPFDDERRYAGNALNAILGGSMSSRLFQEVREKRGLVYAIYSMIAAFQGTGFFGVYAGTRPENIKEVVGIIRSELTKISDHAPSIDELNRIEESLCGQLLLGQESTNTRMIRLGRRETIGSEQLSVDDIVERYRSLSPKDIQNVAQAFLEQEPTIAVISPYEVDRVKEAVSAAK